METEAETQVSLLGEEDEFYKGAVEEVPTKSELAAAIHAAQSELENPTKDSKNPYFKSDYLSLSTLLDVVRDAYNHHGIAVIQDVIAEENRIGCVTILVHKSGEQMRFGPLMLPTVKQDPQAYGSAISYARRYHLQAIAGIAGVDDDGEAAMERKRKVVAPEDESQEPDANSTEYRNKRYMDAVNVERTRIGEKAFNRILGTVWSVTKPEEILNWDDRKKFYEALRELPAEKGA